MNPNNTQTTTQPDVQPLTPSQPTAAYEETTLYAPEQSVQAVQYAPVEQTTPQPFFASQPAPRNNKLVLWIGLVIDVMLIGVTTWFLVTHL